MTITILARKEAIAVEGSISTVKHADVQRLKRMIRRHGREAARDWLLFAIAEAMAAADALSKSDPAVSIGARAVAARLLYVLEFQRATTRSAAAAPACARPRA